MGADDENEGTAFGECPGHEWVPVDIRPVERDGRVGMAIVNECRCGALFYEPSNVDRYAETRGIDPRLV